MLMLILALIGPVPHPRPTPKPTPKPIQWTRSASFFDLYLPTRYSGYDCPVHGPLFNSDFTGYDAWTIVGPKGCPRRMICTKCLMNLIETPSVCLPELIDVRENND